MALPTNRMAVNIVYPVSANQEADTRPAPPLVLCIRKELFKCRLTLAEYTFVIEMMVLEISGRERRRYLEIFSIFLFYEISVYRRCVERRILKKTFIPIKLIYLNNEKLNLAQRIRCEKKEETKD